jgi:hypothetical protein
VSTKYIYFKKNQNLNYKYKKSIYGKTLTHSLQIEAQFLPQLDLRKLTHQHSNQNLKKFSQVKGLRPVSDFRDLTDRI